MNINKFFNVIYIEDDTNSNPFLLLEQFYSKNKIKQLRKQGGIAIATDKWETWIKVGKQYYIITNSWNYLAQQALIWNEYHFELKPKTLKWKIQ